MEKNRVGVIGLKGLPSFGGAARVGEAIIEQLKCEYEFTVYATSSHTEKEGDLGGYQQVVFRKLPHSRINVFYYYLVSALHAVFLGKYDLIHLHHVDGAFVVPLLRLRYKVIGTTHGRPQERDKWKSVTWYFKTVEKIFLQTCDVITSVAKPLQQTYEQMVSRKIEYVPNGINVSEKVDAGKLQYSDYLMFSAGRIMATKGCHTFLEALRKLDYHGLVLVVGDLGQIPEYEQRIRNLAKGLNVVFVPLIKEKAVLLNYVRNAKLFVFPSSIEAMSIMMLEVASMQTPLICSDIPENKEVFNDEETLFFRTEDAADLAEKITTALNEPQVMRKKCEMAYAKLHREFSWVSIAQRYSELYRSVLM
ncbi:MAG: glycosyltransferase family 4 protein [Flavobacteriales bacterium]|nr:glycosyltransferase family 4 protein [Flavobacteriales bacterium]